LESLRDLGNTVLVVEHDEDTIRSADYVLDLGPGAGKLGGPVVAQGTPANIMEAPGSLTGRYLFRGNQRPASPDTASGKWRMGYRRGRAQPQSAQHHGTLSTQCHDRGDGRPPAPARARW